MNKLIYILLLTLMPAVAGFAQQNDTANVHGRQILTISGEGQQLSKAVADSLYAAEQYQTAADIYEHLLADNGQSAAVCYNLGNAYYRLGMYAKAILNYERAVLLDPSDSDVRANLALAYSKTVDKYESEGQMFYTRWFEGIKDLLSSDGWAYLGAASFIAFVLLLSLYIWGRRTVLRKVGFFGFVICFVSTIVANLCAFAQRSDILAADKGIVMIPSVTVRSTPSDTGTALFVIHEGYKVNIIDKTMKEWVEISINSDKTGWVPAGALEVI